MHFCAADCVGEIVVDGGRTSKAGCAEERLRIFYWNKNSANGRDGDVTLRASLVCRSILSWRTVRMRVMERDLDWDFVRLLAFGYLWQWLRRLLRSVAVSTGLRRGCLRGGLQKHRRAVDNLGMLRRMVGVRMRRRLRERRMAE